MRTLSSVMAVSLLLIACSCQKQSQPIAAPPSASTPALIRSDMAVTVTTETFETGTKAAYAAANVTLATGVWNFNDALLGNLSTDHKTGTQSARIRNSGSLT